MTSRAALCMALLEGRVLNVKNVFENVGLTNCSREISRMIEKPFGVKVSKYPTEGKNRYGQRVSWYNYFLVHTKANKSGIKKMRQYIKSLNQ